MKKDLANTTRLTQPKPLTPKELARAMGKAPVNRAIGVKGGQVLVKRQ
ncbi:hypothetical protein PsAD2_00408 [Pseudovibrio axinellae]|uniref:Uncharacterized protein n=1 Tax=Pseudovibrio axinellae TaxID=989403 RepID=A0A161VAP0_9HYPH|nr:hypothetical protein PsAD2_00408 [Pseudovibrio axinellae]SEQ88469.1 hypothetical protein SAMN05421798_10512 [Pseudovibrio axinellae]